MNKTADTGHSDARAAMPAGEAAVAGREAAKVRGRPGSAHVDAAAAGREVATAGKAAATEGPCPSHCPIRDLISRLGDKWSVLVLIALAKTESKCLRFSQLMRSVDGISQRMLSTTLRYLERDGIVTRRLYPEVPPRVEYTLTERGLGLLEPVRALFMWIDHEWPAIERSRREYDARNEERVADSAKQASRG
jgi:DNA-binding HxlR family transcriptional regulator